MTATHPPRVWGIAELYRVLLFMPPPSQQDDDPLAQP